MYINLYPSAQLRKTKQFLLLSGLFLFVGGGYALMREMLLREIIRTEWALSAALLVGLGIAGIGVGIGKINLKQAFFAMDPERIEYRLAPFGQQQKLYWEHIQQIIITGHAVTFCLIDQKKVVLRLGAIQDAEAAHNVATSLRLAALDKNILVNGVQMHPARQVIPVRRYT